MKRTTQRIATMLAIGTVALAGCTGGTEEPTTAPTTDGTIESGPSDGGEETASETPADDCSPDDSDQKIPAEAPTADAWPDVNGLGTPVSDTYGPLDREDDVWTCFAHSPTGALFFASYTLSGIASPEFREVYIPDNPLAEEGQGSDSSGTTIEGFRYLSYTPEEAQLEIAVTVPRDGESILAAVPVTAHWDGKNWILDYSELESREYRGITGLTGFTPWGVGS